MTRAKEEDARERALNASPLNYSAVHTHGNRRTVKSMNPAMEFARRGDARHSSRRRESVRAFSVPGFSTSYPPWRIIPRENWSFEGLRASDDSRIQELRISGIRNFTCAP